MIDRTFVEGDTRWIIDYKTSPLPAGLNQQDFIHHQMEKYRPQLSHYRHIMQKRDTRTVKTALYFPLMDYFSIMDDA